MQQNGDRPVPIPRLLMKADEALVVFGQKVVAVVSPCGTSIRWVRTEALLMEASRQGTCLSRAVLQVYRICPELEVDGGTVFAQEALQSFRTTLETLKLWIPCLSGKQLATLLGVSLTWLYRPEGRQFGSLKHTVDVINAISKWSPRKT